MAELLAIGKDLKGLSMTSKANADGSAVIDLAGDGYRPELRLTKAEVLSLLKALAPPAPAPIPAPTPAPIPVPAPSKIVIGANGASGWGPEDAKKLVALGFKGDRVELGGPYTTMVDAAANGLHQTTVIVGNTDDATPLSAVPILIWVEKTVAEIRAEVMPYASSVTLLECMNEPYLKGTRQEGSKWVPNTHEPFIYAQMYLALKAALRNAGIMLPLGWCTSADYKLPSGAWSQLDGGAGWNGDAIRQYPELLTEIDCIVAHPYGLAHADNGEHTGPGGMEDQHAQLVKFGVKNTDFYITEYGVQAAGTSTDALAEQEANITAAYLQFTKLPYVKGIWYYQVHDDGTGKWGLVTSPWTPRPSLEAVASFA